MNQIVEPIGQTNEIEVLGAPTEEVVVEQTPVNPETELNAYLIVGQERASFNDAVNTLSTKGIQALLDEATYSPELQEERYQRQVQDFQDKYTDVYNYPDLAYDQLLAVADPDVGILDFRYNVNLAIAQEVLRQLRQEEADGTPFVDAALDFGAMLLRESTTAIPYNIRRGSEEQGRELTQRFLTMRPSELKEWFTSYAQGIMAQGIRDENVWNIEQLEEEVFNNGYDPMASINQAFGFLDLTGIVGGGFKLARAGTKAATRAGRTAAMTSVEEATETTIKRAMVRVDDETINDLTVGTLNPARNEVGPAQTMYSRIIKENSIVQDVKELFEAGTFGRLLSEESVERIGSRLTKEFAQRTGYRVVSNEIVSDSFGSKFGIVYDIGTSKGVPYKTTPTGKIPANIQRMAEEMGGKAVLKDADNPKSGVVIRFSETVKADALIDEIDINELDKINTNVFAKIVNNPYTASATGRGVDLLNIAAQRAEGGAAKLQSIFNKEIRKVNKLSATERTRLNIITDLRDGVGTSARKTWYTEEEFIKDYTRRFKEAPSEKLVEAYRATVTISDAAWLLKDQQIYRKYLQADFKSVQVGEINVPARQVDAASIPSDALVFDGKYGATILKSDFKKEQATFYRLDKPLDDGVEYVADPKAVNELNPWDVLGYNAGGPRANPRANYFILTGQGGRIKTLLTAVTEKQARLAREQIDTIRQNIDNLTDDLIQKNNDWNPEIQTVEQLQEFARENGWKLDADTPVAYKQRNGSLIDDGVKGVDTTPSVLTLDEFVQADLRRNDRVLPNFGGGKTHNVDTVTAVQQQFASVANEFSFHVATSKAIVGWVKKAKEINTIKFPVGIDETDYRNLFLRAEISGTDAVSNRMREIRAIEMRRMNVKSEAAEGMARLGERLGEFIFDLGDGELLRSTKAGRVVGDVLQSDTLGTFVRDPSRALLNLGFVTPFGFFNVSQLLVQSMHAVSIMAMSPVHGVKGAVMAARMRGLYHVSPEAAEEGFKRLAPIFGYDIETMRDIHKYVRTSGRDVIEGEAIELGTGAAYGISGWGGQSYKLSAMDKVLYNTTKAGRAFMDKGLMFYRGGERAARMTGIYTAVAEYIAEFPKRSLTSEHARNWITHREQTLTLNMTTTSRGFVQSGVMRVPTQFLSYMLRASEALFVGRGLSGAERRRLFYSLVPFYGLSGFGMEKAAEELAEAFGISEDSAAFTTLKWGVLDGLTDALLPEGEDEGRVGTGLSKRLSVVQGITDVYSDIVGGQSTFLEVVGGPSYSITKSFMEAGFSVIHNGLAGNPHLLTEDVLEFVRQPSGVDNVAKALGIFNNGLYISKTGTAIPIQMGVEEGIMSLFGVNNLKATEWYSSTEQVYTDRRKLQDFRNHVNNRSEVAYRYIQEGNVERGLAILGEIRTEIAFSGFSVVDQQSLFRSALTRDENQFDRLLETLLKSDREAALRLMAVQR